MGADLHGQQSPNVYGIFHNLHGWRDRHNLDRYLRATQSNKYGLNGFESCDSGEVLYELSDYSNLADHWSRQFSFNDDQEKEIDVKCT